MDNQPDFAFYQIYLEAGLAELESYLLSADLFWTVTASATWQRSYPKLTLGGLLLYQKYAQLLAQTAPQRLACQKLDAQLKAQRTHWCVAWEKKAAWEFQSRLRQWSQSLKELRENPSENAAYYHSEVRTRLLLTLLQPEVGEIDPAYPEFLHTQDFLLQALLQPGAFIWEPELAPAFPQEAYWYLWGLPRQEA